MIDTCLWLEGTHRHGVSCAYYGTLFCSLPPCVQRRPSHVDTPVVVQLSEAKARSSCPLRITACFPFHVGPAVSKLACENSVLVRLVPC